AAQPPRAARRMPVRAAMSVRAGPLPPVRAAAAQRQGPAGSLRPLRGAALNTGARDVIISASNLQKRFPAPWGSGGAPVKAVDGVDLEVARGETLGLVGESGSGKSTLGRLLLRLLEADAGTIRFQNQDLTKLSSRRLRQLRPRMQIVFQNPYSALNPRMRVDRIIGFNVRAARQGADDRRGRVAETRGRVRTPASSLPPPAAVRDSHRDAQRRHLGRALSPAAPQARDQGARRAGRAPRGQAGALSRSSLDSDRTAAVTRSRTGIREVQQMKGTVKRTA